MDPALDDGTILDTFLENQLVTAAVEELLVKYLTAVKRECTPQELREALPNHSLSEPLLNRVAERMLNSGKLLQDAIERIRAGLACGE